MKQIKSAILIAIGVFTFSISGNLNAQTTNPDTKHLSDEEILKGFDTKACIEHMKAEGVPESEYLGCLRGRKMTYLLNQKGIKATISFPSKNLPTGPCVNAGFEDTTFANWTAGTGNLTNYPGPTTWTPGFSTTTINALESDPLARQTIMTNAAGFDVNAISTVSGLPEIPYTAPGGGGVSVRLGNSYVTGVANTAETEKLDYPITVTPTNTSFTYKYAVVLENPTGHTATQQPRFTIQVYDMSGNIVTGPCGTYNVDGIAASTDTSYHPFNLNGFSPDGYYKRWTTVTIDLTPFIGTTVTIEFVTQDCTLGGHFGYAYIDCSCAQLQAQVAFCPNDTILSLVAPAGFVSYQWYDGGGILIPGATHDTLLIPHPVLGQIYSVSMFSASGCATSLTVTLQTSTMQIFHGILNGTCSGVNNGLAYVTTTGANPPLTYIWHNLGNGNVVGGNNDSIINMPPGWYYVNITSSGGCSGTDTMQINNPALPSDTTFRASKFICPGDSIITLYAPGGQTTYTWLDQNNTPVPIAWGGQSAVVHIHNPIVPRIYYCALDCPHWFADTLKNATLNLTTPIINNDSCYGSSNGSAMLGANVNDSLNMAGPFIYTWTNSTGTVVSTTSTYSAAPAGTYIVTVHTVGGTGTCSKSDTVRIAQPPNSDTLQVGYSLCPDDAEITLHVPSGYAAYQWYPNSTATGAVISTYDSLVIPGPIIGNQYTCVLTPAFGCKVTLNTTLKISPPPNFPNYLVNSNVFTPDGDGKNDKYDVSLDPKTHLTYSYVKTFHIEIYNRWGKKVFESNDVSNQWDGTIDGAKADEGVYYWMCSFTSSCSANDTPIQNKGFVHLFRNK